MKTATGIICLGQQPNTLCFVPTEAIIHGPIPELNEKIYCKGFWQIENLACSEGGHGGHLFPLIPLEPATSNYEKFVEKMKLRGIQLNLPHPN